MHSSMGIIVYIYIKRASCKSGMANKDSLQPDVHPRVNMGQSCMGCDDVASCVNDQPSQDQLARFFEPHRYIRTTAAQLR